MHQSNKNDLWALNFLRLANQSIITSGLNIRIEKAYLTSNICQYGFDAKDDSNIPIYLHEGKKMICVRTKNYQESYKRIQNLVLGSKDLNTYYDWKLFSEGHHSSPDHLMEALAPCHIEDIIDYVHKKYNKDSFLIENGPSTVFRYFKKENERINPIKTIYASVHIGHLPKGVLVYGKESEIDFEPTICTTNLSKVQQNDANKISLFNGFKKVHENSEVINNRLWKYFILHKTD